MLAIERKKCKIETEIKTYTARTESAATKYDHTTTCCMLRGSKKAATGS